MSSPSLGACKWRLKDSAWGMWHQVLICWARPKHVIKNLQRWHHCKDHSWELLLKVNFPKSLSDLPRGPSLSKVDPFPPHSCLPGPRTPQRFLPRDVSAITSLRRVKREGHLSCRAVNAFVSLFIYHIHTALFKIDQQQGPTVQHREVCSMLCGSLDGKAVWGENGHVYMCGWVPSLFIWNYHNIVHRLYANKKLKWPGNSAYWSTHMLAVDSDLPEIKRCFCLSSIDDWTGEAIPQSHSFHICAKGEILRNC